MIATLGACCEDTYVDDPAAGNAQRILIDGDDASVL